MREQITAVSVDHGSPYRAWYHLREPVLDANADLVEGARADEDEWKAVRWSVTGWAAMGGCLWPVRVEDRTGRGVLCGSEHDPLREDFLGVLVAGAPLADLGPEVDALIRERLREEVESADG